MLPTLPEKPTPDQLSQIVLVAIKAGVEPDVATIESLSAIEDGWSAVYATADSERFQVDYTRSEGFSKVPMGTNLSGGIDPDSEFAEVDSRSTMLAFWLPADVAKAIAISPDDLPEAEPPDQLHLTLAYFGKLPKVPLPKWTKAIQKLCDRTPPITAKLGAWGRFPASESSDNKDVIWAGVDAPGLIELRQELIELSTKLDLEAYGNHGYTPHITLAYIPPSKEFTPEIEPLEVVLDRVALTIGTAQYSFLLQGTVDNAEPPGVTIECDPVFEFVEPIQVTDMKVFISASKSIPADFSVPAALSDRLTVIRDALEVDDDRMTVTE